MPILRGAAGALEIERIGEERMFTNLKLLIWRSRIHQNRMAQEIQMDEAVLSRIINGFRKPSSEQRRVIASYLGAEEEWLFAHDEQLQPIPRNNDKNRPASSKNASAGSRDGLAGEGSN